MNFLSFLLMLGVGYGITYLLEVWSLKQVFYTDFRGWHS